LFVIWLTFEKNDEDYLEKIISNLSKKYNSNLFQPHITIWGLTNVELDKISKICKNISIEIKSFNVEFLNILYSDNFWKTLFLNLKTNKNMTKIYKNLENEFEKNGNHIFEPHISLIYKNMQEKDKKEIIENIKIKDQFKISNISILKYSDKIENWKIVKKISLK
tara:strand:- start:1060 stop:1554 length:495 start_codon:yes stop_codon:yes gene_type:complete